MYVSSVTICDLGFLIAASNGAENWTGIDYVDGFQRMKSLSTL